MEYQDKQIQIVIEELKSLQQKHYKILKEYRARLKWKEDAGRVLLAMREGKTDRITGGEMAKFMTILEENKFYVN